MVVRLVLSRSIRPKAAVPIRFVVALLLFVFLAMVSEAHAQNWADFAAVSMTHATTPKLSANRLCYTDGTDMLCDGAAGLLITSGTLQINSISTTNVSATGNVWAVKFIGDGSGLTGISAQGDRITSGTTSMVAQTASNIISITTNGVNTRYFNSDGVGLERSRMRRFLLIKLEATIQGEFTRDFIRQVECEIAGEQRAA